MRVFERRSTDESETVKRLLATSSLLISTVTVTAASSVIVPRALVVLHLRQAADDPVALTELR